MSATIPASRTLAAVLRSALDQQDSVRLLLGTFGPADASAAYCNVVLQGTPLRVPMLRGVTDTQGAAAYLLATKDFILCIGSVAP
jgi:hypothetical protein